MAKKPKRLDEETEMIMSDAADALDQVVQWMENFAIPMIVKLSEDDDVDGGNSLAAGLTMKADEIRDFLKARSE